LLQYDICHTDPSVERLPVHLPFENSVVFTEEDDLEEVIENPNNLITKCWGLDLRVKPSPSETIPNSFAGPNERKPSIPEGIE